MKSAGTRKESKIELVRGGRGRGDTRRAERKDGSVTCGLGIGMRAT